MVRRLMEFFDSSKDTRCRHTPSRRFGRIRVEDRVAFDAEYTVSRGLASRLVLGMEPTAPQACGNLGCPLVVERRNWTYSARDRSAFFVVLRISSLFEQQQET